MFWLLIVVLKWSIKNIHQICCAYNVFLIQDLQKTQLFYPKIYIICITIISNFLFRWMLWWICSYKKSYASSKSSKRKSYRCDRQIKIILKLDRCPLLHRKFEWSFRFACRVHIIIHNLLCSIGYYFTGHIIQFVRLTETERQVISLLFDCQR